MMATRASFICAMLLASAAHARALPDDLRSRSTPMPGDGGPAASADAALDEGRALLLAANPVHAVAAFRTALAADPRSIAALNGLGVAYDRLGRADLARQHFEQALALDPSADDIAYNLGWSLVRAGQDRDAIAPLQRAAAGRDPRAASAARRALALIAARLEAAAVAPAAPAASPARMAVARIDMVASGEAVLVLPAATPAVALAAAPARPVAPSVAAAPPALTPAAPATALPAEVAARLGDAADLIRPADPVPVAQAAAEPPTRPDAPITPPRREQDSPRALPALAETSRQTAPAPPVASMAIVAPGSSSRRPVLANATAAALVQQRPTPALPPPPRPADEPGADIRMAIARLERLIALIEAGRG